MEHIENIEQRGRPKKYATPEEAKRERTRLQNIYMCNRYRDDPEFREHVRQKKREEYQKRKLRDDYQLIRAKNKEYYQRNKDIIKRKNLEKKGRIIERVEEKEQERIQQIIIY
jgi:hypothetical protein